ncbi:tetratricopeptide repeat protein [Poriferisphaera sp. WC338]|uniref:tetratricopeptide repeat protein n=1 Tax=Poriferisphaera sp. WC338 TaxID=3425129 RepID=UPI003D81B248
MALFGKSSGSKEFKPNLRNARKFFDHASTYADSRNYDGAVEMFISGLRHDPDNLTMHEELYEVAKRRKVGGGKPAGFSEKMKSIGPSNIDKMLQAEKLWAKDLFNCELLLDAMDHAVDADKEFEKAAEAEENGEVTIHIGEIANWLGSLVLEYATQYKDKQQFKYYRKVCNLFQEIGMYDQAFEACKRMNRLSPNDTNLRAELKSLDAAKYNMASTESEDFRGNIKDADEQRELELEDASVRTESAVDEMIANRRADYEEDPEDLDKRMKFVETLLKKEDNETENEAIQLLTQTWEENGQYRYKMRVGDIQIKQMNRNMRSIREELKKKPDSEPLKLQYKEARKTQLAFELKEFDERVKNYPTDLAMKYELGRRQHESGMLDEAIGTFQQAKQDPKHRAMSHYFLGDCYLHKGWMDEAIDTLRTGIEAHKVPDDKIAMALNYLLMGSLEKAGENNNNLEQLEEASKIGSKILQNNINYKDIKDRMNKLRDKVNSAKNNG